MKHSVLLPLLYFKNTLLGALMALCLHTDLGGAPTTSGFRRRLRNDHEEGEAPRKKRLCNGWKFSATMKWSFPYPVIVFFLCHIPKTFLLRMMDSFTSHSRPYDYLPPPSHIPRALHKTKFAQNQSELPLFALDLVHTLCKHYVATTCNALNSL